MKRWHSLASKMTKLAIIGAMREEIAPLLALFPQAKSHQLGDNTFYEIAYKNACIYIAYSKIGKVHAAMTATAMILHFGCKKVIFSGVAGGLREDLKIGELILATEVCQHDIDITAFGHPLGFIPESSTFIQSDASLNALAKKIARQKNLTLKEGIIASGDQFISSAEKKHWITKNFKASAVEMEGAAVGVVCQSFGIPFCIFRSISDDASQDANVSFDDFLDQAAKTSALFVKEMIEHLIKDAPDAPHEKH